MTLTLGVHLGPHDSSAAIVDGGRLLAVMEQERIDHKKHSGNFPTEAIELCLKEVGLTFAELNYIAYASDSELTNQYKNCFIEARHPGAFVPKFYGQDDLDAKVIASLGNEIALFHVDHHTGHAASCFYLSPFEESAILSVDGMGNWISAALCKGNGRRIETYERIAHPQSLGLFYGAVTQFLGFEANCDEGKTMGLAPYGKPTFVDDLRSICDFKGDSLALDLDYFAFHRQPLVKQNGRAHTWYSRKFVKRFGPARTPDSEITERDEDLACSVQQLLEELSFQLLRQLHERASSENLCVVGGVALNCTMNGKIADNTPFKNVFVMPAANDAGLSIGAALACNAFHDPKFERCALANAFFGTSHNEEDILEAVQNLPDDIVVTKPDSPIRSVANLLHEHRIVGCYQGRMEFGPRALGNRSILANPCREEMKDIVNAKVKFREKFRPFSPVVPLECAADFFHLSGSSPFMLKAVQVRQEKRSIIPAVTHVNGSARVQTVTEAQNEFLHRLLHEVGALNGVPVLLNTSFNVRGDTIVRTPDDAIKCFLSTGMHALIIGPFLLTKGDVA